MFNRPVFSQTGALFQLVLLLSAFLLGLILSLLAGMALSMLFFGLSYAEFSDVLMSETHTGLMTGRLVQVISQLGLFIFPPIVFSLLVSSNMVAHLGFNRQATFRQFIVFAAIMFSCLPLIHELALWNEQLRLPGSLASLEQWMQNQEATATRITEFFLGVTSLGGLAFNLFMVAIIPAVGEELLFRSALQPLLGRLFRNHHIGVIITALIFSLMHLQFYGFLPRFMLGLFLGYAYLWSRSIWVPIVMHFVNNAAAIIVFYLAHNNYIQVPMDEFGAGGGTGVLVVSIFLSGMLLFFGWRISARRNKKYIVSGQARELDQ